MCGNVRLQLTSSLWLHRRVQKGTVAAEEVGKTFPSLAAFGLRSCGTPQVICVSDFQTLPQGPWKGEFQCLAGLLG